MKQACYVSIATEQNSTHDETTSHFVFKSGLRPVSRRLPGEVVINGLRKSYGIQYILALIGARRSTLFLEEYIGSRE